MQQLCHDRAVIQLLSFDRWGPGWFLMMLVLPVVVMLPAITVVMIVAIVMVVVTILTVIWPVLLWLAVIVPILII